MKLKEFLFGDNSLKSASIVAICIYTLQIVSALIISYLFDSQNNFLAWDAKHYYAISQNGYDQKFITAFFPLFPAIWNVLSFSPLVMAIVNGMIWMVSAVIITHEMKLSKFHASVIMLLPSMIFMYLPYSESLFAAFSSMIIIGIKRQKDWLVFLGFVFANLCRPAGTIFIPAIIIVLLLSDYTWKKKAIKIVLFSTANIIGLAIVALIHSYYQWQWDISISAQSMWGNELQMPTLPLKSWGGNWNNRFDGLVLFLVLSGGVLIGFDALKKGIHQIPKEIQFCLLYTLGITFSVLLFRGGLLFSLNRFVFGTIMGGIFLIHVLKSFDWTIKRTAIYSFVSLIYFVALFAAYNHIMNLVKYALFSLTLGVLILLLGNSRFNTQYTNWLGLAILFCLQQLSYYLFLNEIWIA